MIWTVKERFWITGLMFPVAASTALLDSRGTTSIKQALQRARQVFLDGLRSLPWCKPWVIMGLHAFARDGGLSPKELRQVYDVLGERELRVRVGLEEMADATAKIDIV